MNSENPAVKTVEKEPEVPMCPPHESLLRSGQLAPFDNCVACIRNHRDSLARVLSKVADHCGASLPEELRAEIESVL